MALICILIEEARLSRASLETCSTAYTTSRGPSMLLPAYLPRGMLLQLPEAP